MGQAVEPGTPSTISPFDSALSLWAFAPTQEAVATSDKAQYVKEGKSLSRYSTLVSILDNK